MMETNGGGTTPSDTTITTTVTGVESTTTTVTGVESTTTVTGVESTTSTGNIKIIVFHGSNKFDIFTTPQSTFADLKREIAKVTGLDPKVQNMLFRGIAKDDNESLEMAGVKDNTKVVLLENPPTKDECLEDDKEIKESIEETSRGLEAVNLVREENNQFEEQVVALETAVCSGTHVPDKDFIFLTEMLIRQLLKLDEIDCEGEVRIQRKLEVRRVQVLVERLDNLQAENFNPTNNDPPETPNEPPLPSSS
ncbi:hypothetical protein QVD17_02930 [Tagetes erecta]|uniref:Uncharacterized protein n=1 Tax=Tagetes erecta TaxID=13708 RepID=A0AAD8L7G4_TARER|nr:hypothetical protein QVD17_02930 [Tagetes erecta]